MAAQRSATRQGQVRGASSQETSGTTSQGFEGIARRDQGAISHQKKACRTLAKTTTRWWSNQEQQSSTFDYQAAELLKQGGEWGWKYGIAALFWTWRYEPVARTFR